jgi:hypothetical protein
MGTEWSGDKPGIKRAGRYRRDTELRSVKNVKCALIQICQGKDMFSVDMYHV